MAEQSDREVDELIELGNAYIRDVDIEEGSFAALVRDLLNALITSLPRPRVVETVEQVRELRVDTVIRDAGGGVFELVDRTTGGWWMNSGEDVTFDDAALTLPAIVLWDPTP